MQIEVKEVHVAHTIGNIIDQDGKGLTIAKVLQGDGDLLVKSDCAKHAHLQSASLQSTFASQLPSMHAQWYNGVPREFKALMTGPILSQVRRNLISQMLSYKSWTLHRRLCNNINCAHQQESTTQCL